MRIVLAFSTVAALVLAACGTDEKTTVVAPAGSTVTVPADSDSQTVITPAPGGSTTVTTTPAH